MNAGDVVLAHCQLGHTGAPNCPRLGARGVPEETSRYAVFFRLHHEHHDPDALGILADIWREFPSLQHLARG